MVNNRVVTAVAVLIGIYLNFQNVRKSLERSFVLQSVHYFSRPHEGIPSEPVMSPANWRSADLLRRQSEWTHVLSDDEISEIQKAVADFKARNVTLEKMKKSDFRLPLLRPMLRNWTVSLNPASGLGVVVIKRVPVHTWTMQESSIFWWGIGLHLGSPGAQNGRGDLLGHVKNEMQEKIGNVRQYLTNERIGYHCDVADVVGLLCLETAATGGRSRIASSVAVFNELQRTRPGIIHRLFEPLRLDTRGDGGFNYIFITPCRYFGKILRTFWHTDYFRSGYKYEDSEIQSIPADIEDLVASYDAIANSPEFTLEMEFEQGDVQLISNHVVIHGRSAFKDEADSAKVRHLLRLWLSLPSEQSFMDVSQRVSRVGDQLSLIANYVGGLREYLFANL